MTESPHLAAVISGDLILSEKLPAAVRRAVPGRLDACARLLRTDLGLDCSDIDVFRGDAWQMIVRDPAAAVTVCLLIRAELRSWQSELDTRTVIGIGRIDSEGDGRVSTGYGEAFTLSGRALDDLPKDRRMALRIADAPAPLVDILDAGVHLLDEIVDGWTAAQSRAIVGAMKRLSQDEIGASWATGPISQQAVAQHLRRASWGATEHWLGAFPTLLRHHFERD